jgi:hypothetical protein
MQVLCRHTIKVSLLRKWDVGDSEQRQKSWRTRDLRARQELHASPTRRRLFVAELAEPWVVFSWEAMIDDACGLGR